MLIDTVLLDLDNTLLDFEESSYHALCAVYRQYGIEYTREQFSVYSAVNDRYWKAYERGEIPREKVFTERFAEYLPTVGVAETPEIFDRKYRAHLKEGFDLMPHAKELLDALYGKYRLYVVTNGDAYSQYARLRGAGIMSYFDNIFVSEELGCKKPEKGFFDKVFAVIGEECRSTSLLVGDSLSSDMQGGRNSAIRTCLYAVSCEPDERCDDVIYDLMELPDLLLSL